MNLFEDLEKNVDTILRRANGKVLVLWGYGYGGIFFERLLYKRGRSLDLIIDNLQDYPSKFRVFKMGILDEIDVDNAFFVVSFRNETEVKVVMQHYGIKDENVVILSRDLIGNNTVDPSYYGWLESIYSVDIMPVVDNQNGENNKYSAGNGYAIQTVIDDFCFSRNDKVFDFGSGKGGPMIMFYNSGASVGGVEYDKCLYEVALKNFAKVGMNDFELFNADATKLSDELDGYNYFYMYNSFVGDTLRKVINNIEKSFDRCNRRIILIYSGVTCHRIIENESRFRFVRRISNDFWNKYTNVYLME